MKKLLIILGIMLILPKPVLANNVTLAENA